VYERVGPLRAVIKQGQRTHSTSDIPFHGLDGYQWEVPALGAAGTYSLTVTLKDDEFQLNIPPWSENIVVKSGQPASLSFYVRQLDPFTNSTKTKAILFLSAIPFLAHRVPWRDRKMYWNQTNR
jgi:hypothetical protein